MAFLRWTGLAALAGLLVAAACSRTGLDIDGSNDSGTASQSNDGGVTITLPDGSSDTADANEGEDAGPLAVGLWIGGLHAYYAYSLTALTDGGVFSTDGGPPIEPAPMFRDICPIMNGPLSNGLASTSPAAFDASGNLWVDQAGVSSASLTMWSAAELAAACSSGKPARTIALNIALNPPQGQVQVTAMAFDGNGTLWLAFADYGALAGVTSAQLLASGSVVPTYFIQGGGIGGPGSLAFDAAGDLWVANGFSVLEYTRATLATALTTDDGGAADATPSAQLTTAGDSDTVAFDENGNLWVSCADYDAQPDTYFIAGYAPADLATLSTNAKPAPLVLINQLPGFGAIAFDALDNLWLGTDANLYRFPPSSLGGGDRATASYDLEVQHFPTVTSVSLTFNPIPPGLPIQP